ncbi:MAG: hypothetical protein A2041_06505 [Bacteroidetes bacterium GWA2_31_9b]|nr:MAG: hypothetical protein A2041_06505 [Bacteroidetes bacterium GWA2_31_9b]
MRNRITVSLFFVLLTHITLLAQDDLLAMLDSIQPDKKETFFVDGTFKSVRLINGYNTELAPKHDLVFSISHRFGNVNQGIHDFFGLDLSTIRFGFEYGLSNRFDIGIGRSNYEDIYDGFIKAKIARQSSGKKNFPFTITLLEGIAVSTLEWTNKEVEYPITGRMFYIHELFISRKFNEKLSLQLSPVIIHRNMVETREDQNTVGAIGFGGRYKITNHFTTVVEYYYLLPGETADKYVNSLALGVELETGGHVFQLHFSNSKGMTEKVFIPETNGSWQKGDINFGFNIIRLFDFKN